MLVLLFVDSRYENSPGRGLFLRFAYGKIAERSCNAPQNGI